VCVCVCRYILVLYYKKEKMDKKLDILAKQEQLNKLKKKYGVDASTPK